MVQFFQRMSPGDRFTVEWIKQDSLAQQSVHAPTTAIWRGTYLRRCDDADGDHEKDHFQVNYDNEPSVNRTLPPPDSSVWVIKLIPLHDAGLVASTDRIPPTLISSRPNASFIPEVVIFFDGGYDNATKICNSAVFAKVFLW